MKNGKAAAKQESEDDDDDDDDDESGTQTFPLRGFLNAVLFNPKPEV